MVIVMCQNKICVVYQYLLFNADRLKDKKIKALERLNRTRGLSSSDLIDIYSDVLRSEFFEQVFDDLYELLK